MDDASGPAKCFEVLENCRNKFDSFNVRNAFYKSFKAKSSCESIFFAPFYVNSSRQNRFECFYLMMELWLLRNVGFYISFLPFYTFCCCNFYGKHNFRTSLSKEYPRLSSIIFSPFVFLGIVMRKKEKRFSWKGLSGKEKEQGLCGWEQTDLRLTCYILVATQCRLRDNSFERSSETECMRVCANRAIVTSQMNHHVIWIVWHTLVEREKSRAKKWRVFLWKTLGFECCTLCNKPSTKKHGLLWIQWFRIDPQGILVRQEFLIG